MNVEITPGYKQTELGIVPEDWQIQSLPETLQFISGKAHEQFINEVGPYVVVNSKFISTEGSVRKYSSENFCPAKRGDVLMVMSDLPNGRALAKCYLVKEDKTYAVNQRVCIFRPIKGSSEYFYYLLNRNKYFMQFDDGVQQTHLLNPMILNCQLKVPPEPEQYRIGKALADIDSLINSLDQLITKKSGIQQAAMQQLLTGQRRLPGFSGMWSRHALRDLVSTPVTDGPHETPRFVENGIPFLSVNNIANNRIDFRDLRFISCEDHRIYSKKCRPQRNDLLLGKAASVGKVALIETDIELNIWSPIALIRMSDAHDPRYFYYAFRSKEIGRQIEVLTNSSSQGNIGMGDIERLLFSVPDLAEQTAIATILSDMDTELAVLEGRRD